MWRLKTFSYWTPWQQWLNLFYIRLIVQTEEVGGRRAAWEERGGVLQSLENAAVCLPVSYMYIMCTGKLPKTDICFTIRFLSASYSVLAIISFHLRQFLNGILVTGNVFLDMVWHTFIIAGISFSKGLLTLFIIIKTTKEQYLSTSNWLLNSIEITCKFLDRAISF